MAYRNTLSDAAADSSKQPSAITDLKKTIQSHIAGMSYAQRLVSMYVLRNMQQLAFLSASDLAERVGVSQATVVRFCQTVGFKGYGEFTDSVQNSVRQEMRSQGHQPTNLPGFTNPDQHKTILDSVLYMQFMEMAGLAANYDQKAIDACVDMMLAARNIYVLSRMSTRSMGIQFVTMLAKVCPCCHLLPDEAMESNVMLQRMTPGDMLLTFSYPRYAKVTLDITRIAKKNGCSIVAVTDSATSPLIPLADISLLAPVSAISFIDVFAAPNALTAALVLEYCNRAPREAADRLNRFDTISRQRHTFLS